VRSVRTWLPDTSQAETKKARTRRPQSWPGGVPRALAMLRAHGSRGSAPVRITGGG
jgi:hypothetical protein